MKITKTKLMEIIKQEADQFLLNEETFSDEIGQALLKSINELISGISELDVSIDYLSAAFTGEDPTTIGLGQSILGKGYRPTRGTRRDSQEVDEMLKRMDIVSINCPLTEKTKGMISENILELMMPNSYIINSSRSEIIDEKALVRMLQEKKIAGAGLDVFGAEKKLKTELLDLPNTILIPHMGSATVEGRIEMGEKVIVNIKTFIDGHNPPNRII